jgi:hypothetical protein
MNRDIARAFAVIEFWLNHFPNSDKLKGFDNVQFTKIFQEVIRYSPTTQRRVMETLKAWEVIGRFNFPSECYIINYNKYSELKKKFPKEYEFASDEFNFTGGKNADKKN